MLHTVEMDLADLITHELENNSLDLPTLPITAKKVREALNSSPDISASEIAEIITTDPAISIYLLKVANSALYSSGKRTFSCVKQAVNILGNARTVRLVTAYAIKQVFTSPSPFYTDFFNDILRHTLAVAAICRGMALFSPNLDPDKAMLAGLVHQIGKLPVLKYLSDTNQQLSKAQVDDLLTKIHPLIGQRILKRWNFPDALIKVAAEYLNFKRNPHAEADYTDIVITAYLQECVNSSHPHENLDWSEIPAFTKLGLSPELSELNDADLINEIETAHATFMLGEK
ncbi:HDOD domain-containing protein [Thalassomonas viridans]|uniref:HDOD domain-containing protein n=1 Tax=Thalassomonas viridans TaxID=137584 RepID=A0AAE9Z8S8_9GAMM|nr:HDOD domain-containing protein [Thalassomonas viridans]WDE07187.1 HDOD domain-containing protein [Thalassomonas viridans]